jgi:hypothetical protein
MKISISSQLPELLGHSSDLQFALVGKPDGLAKQRRAHHGGSLHARARQDKTQSRAVGERSK